MKKTNASILIIDDQEDILFASKVYLKKYFENIHTLNNPKKIVELLSQNSIDVVLLDMNYRIGFEDGREGLYLLKEIKTLSPKTVVILMTAFGKVETAVEGLKAGAFDYILKPWENKKLLESVKQAVDKSRKEQKKNKEIENENDFFVGTSEIIKKAYSLADKVAKTDANVLILGENGTGKFVLAHHIYSQSERKNNPFIAVDLGSLNSNIFESELFGYAKGAFTDAKIDTPGRFEMAQNGTIFLDEIGNVPLHLQSKLLQVIQTKTVTRLGETKARPLNVRIITATNLNLKLEVADKNFREDLYYRINTMEIVLPPLRERNEDKIPLAEYLLEKMRDKYGRGEITFDKKVLEQIENHAWNGNIREMENKIERAVILCENNKITVSDLDLEIITPYDENPDDIQLSTVEKAAIEKALLKHNNNISKTAEELGLSRGSLYRRLEKYNININ
ncbi:sigma-54-dependent transcriptional regulator [Flavobacterium johnsoniae]|uniref:Two component, sigma54 specific, transcriptional regulator, Fis family n=1 Tax=Flavobacterium johnsoniae (strain ATCC 17061 / DSM 2064 / JCM 8514 / BCRC 14874 / CCUG 350202 / NBRC 14942 / NCIMB 11054 / UW101) TaxID=376686 RepID=A5FMR8_FLAJ1|nr:sigma-54 dependent transcriptional regulator [Flavobacterium johnsoniae]ABQ03506.1 two component, sigma54 specific, transcriptional regulator, Fis family [Flavobacterium johnsoniae UW101]OXE97112.1 sigma-54-dependent Fis family transcriptional regulator [Flavobacterium johnsoniae UW101]WQG79631.1 sigma-54 dependent transcriptional regulator [Flavobacterium johnsoniae UW101]SHL73164.1 DNA-binding transcriptional response regulator, NtrC family, contains REC, AAA-type ATPase, and a Fis-type DN